MTEAFRNGKYIMSIIRINGIDEAGKEKLIMDHKRVKRYIMISAAAAAGLYGLAAGKGPFNKTRFREQHEALSKYVDNNYPECSYTSISAHGHGWISSVRKRGRTVAVIYFSKSPDGTYVFTRSKADM